MRLFLLTFVVMAFTSSCEKSPRCWGKTEINEGEIIADTSLTTNCKILTNINEGYVINSQQDLWNVYYKNFGNNGTCEMKSFDFTKYTLFGMTLTASCKYKIKRNVTVNDDEEAYYYDITLKECGNCDEEHYLTNWVMIPKMKSGYKVIFRSNVDN